MSKGRGPQEVEVRVHRLHPGQQRILAHPARFKVVMCGRRFGKSAAGIRWVMDGALAGSPVGWFAPSYKLALEVWRELVDRLRPVTQRISEQDKRLELVTGGVIEVWTLDGPDPARGRKYQRVVIDEAGIVRDLLDLWQQAIRPTLVDLGGEALLLGTPKGRRHGFVTLFQRGERGEDADWASFRAATSENPHIPLAEVEAARRELPPAVFAQEFEGIPTDDGGNPFGLDAIRDAIGPLSPAPTVVYGLDLARALDYTVLLGLDAWRRVTVLDRWQAPWGETKARVQATVGSVPVVADATGVGDAIVADLQAMDVLVTPHVFTAPSKLRLMQRLITACQGRELTVPAGWLPAELDAFEFTYTPYGVKYEAPSGLHDDGVMALGLALHGWDRVQVVVPDVPAPTSAVDPALAGLPVGLLRWEAEDGRLPEDPVGRAVTATVPGDWQAQLPRGGW